MKNKFNLKLLVITTFIIGSLFFLINGKLPNSKLDIVVKYDPVANFINNKDKVDYQEESLIVKFKEDNQDYYEKLRNELNIKIENIDANFNKVIFEEEEYTTEEILKILNDYETVEYAEPDYVFKKVGFPSEEPEYLYQWGLNSDDYGINVVPVWEQTYGMDTTVVAVIDTGINYSHPDLVNQVWTNSGEIRNNGIDDDNNGYIDDYYGWSFDIGNNDPFDIDGHGTHVAGIIAAENNGVGIVGVAPRVKVMGLRVSDDEGQLYLSSILEAVNYALDKGVKIFNFSFGSYSYVQSFYDLIDESDALFICAAGNGGADEIGDDNDIDPFYPASYENKNIISVAATDYYGNISEFSNYGNVSVDIAAPGYDILSTYLGNDYVFMSGTSMAAPFVTGMTALIYGTSPDISLLQLRGHILNNATELPNLINKVVTNGIVNTINSYNSLLSDVPFEGGTGTNENPYLISTVEQLNAIRNNLSASYKIINSIELYASTALETGLFYNSGLGWKPIGTSSKPFTGKIDGAGNSIFGLFINREETSNVGLFGYTENATIDKLVMEMSVINAKSNVGGLIGYAKNSNISRIGVFDTVIDGSGTYIGGIAGISENSTIDRTYSNSVVLGDEIAGIAGGLVGLNNTGFIINSFNLGAIKAKTTGGIAGETFGGSISLVYNLNESLVGIIGGNISDAINIGELDTVNSSTGTAVKDGKNINYTYTIDIKTNISMMNMASYPNFDFTNIWQSNIGNFIYLKDVTYWPVSGVISTLSDINLEGYGTTQQLILKFNPNNASNKNVTWESIDPLIATVDKYGIVTAVSEGSTQIIVRTLDGRYSDTINVNVENKLLGISLEENDIFIPIDYSKKMNVIFYPDSAPNKNVTYVSSNNNVVTVDTEGNIYGVAPGTATIKVTSEEENYEDVATVTVYMKADLNGDSNVTTTDLVKLRRYLAGLETLDKTKIHAADINHDGNVTATDLVKLRKYLAGMGEL